MTTTSLTFPFSSRPDPAKKKRVLLVDASTARRDLRSEIMRKLGMDVDCAANISEARAWWRADLYDLVLMSVDSDLGRRDKFCGDIRAATPPQQMAFLVGKPEYLASSPGLDEAPALPSNGNEDPVGAVRAALSANIPGSVPQRWGIKEACLRIAAVRSACLARSQAMRERPAPPRDPEPNRSRRLIDLELSLQLQREELL
jgi:hypothetical protein